MLNAYKYLTLFALILFIGCADENPLLVNPPNGTDSMFVRVMNLASDGEARQLRFGEASISGSTAYGSLSNIFRAPGDSATGIIIKNGNEEQRTYRKLVFTRTNYHTYFVLPGITAKRNKPADSIIYYTSQARRALTTLNPELRMVNCFPDSNYTFILRLGCQNGEELVRDNGYTTFSTTREIEASQSFAVTLLRVDKRNQFQEIVGLYSFATAQFSSYCFVVYRGTDDGVSCGVIDDRNQTAASFTILQNQPAKQAFVKLINLTTQSADLSKVVDKQNLNLQNGISPNSLSPLIEVGACSSNSVDSFSVSYANGNKRILEFPLQVQKNYTIIAADSLNNAGGVLTILPQISNTSLQSGYSRVYVVNMMNDQTDVTVSLGARNTSDGQLLSGEVLASRIAFTAMSSSVDIPSGELPITIFTTRQPAQLHSTFLGTVSAATTYYLLLWTNSSEGTTNAALLPINEAGKNLTLLERGSFVTFVHANREKSTILFGASGILSNVPLDFRSSTGTVVREGTHTFTAGDASGTVTVNSDSNYIVFARSENGSTRINSFSSAQRTTLYGQARRRCINLTEDIPSFSVNEGTTNLEGIIASSVEQNKYFDTTPVFVERRLLLTFWNGETKLTEMTGLLPLGRNYSIMIGGKAGSYFSLVQQEF